MVSKARKLILDWHAGSTSMETRGLRLLVQACSLRHEEGKNKGKDNKEHANLGRHAHAPTLTLMYSGRRGGTRVR